MGHQITINKFPYRYRVSAMLFSLIVITYLDRVCISLVGVRIKNEFHLTNSEFGWVLGAFAFAYALFEIPSGILGDRLGQRKVLIRIVLWWSLFTALTGLTSGLISLIAIRFLFGIGEAGAFPNSTGVIGRWFPASEVSRGISTLSIGINTGAAIAPLIVVPVAIAFGWRATFFVNALAGMVWAVVCYRWFRDEPAAMKGISMDELGQIEQSRCFWSMTKTLDGKKYFNTKKYGQCCSHFSALSGACIFLWRGCRYIFSKAVILVKVP